MARDVQLANRCRKVRHVEPEKTLCEFAGRRCLRVARPDNRSRTIARLHRLHRPRRRSVLIRARSLRSHCAYAGRTPPKRMRSRSSEWCECRNGPGRKYRRYLGRQDCRDVPAVSVRVPRGRSGRRRGSGRGGRIGVDGCRSSVSATMLGDGEDVAVRILEPGDA